MQRLEKQVAHENTQKARGTALFSQQFSCTTVN